jgi:hypothetical protein
MLLACVSTKPTYMMALWSRDRKQATRSLGAGAVPRQVHVRRRAARRGRFIFF